MAVKPVVYLNGRFLPGEEALIPALEPGFLSGLGLFETMRSYKNKIVCFDRHLRRIQKSAGFMGILLPYPAAKLKRIIEEAVSINDFSDSYVRLTVWKGQKRTQVMVSVKKYTPFPPKKYREGFKVCIAQVRQNEGDPFSRIKSTNRILYEAGFNRAKAKGFDEALILNNRGHITEATRSNLFFVKEGDLFTPALGCGCLEGITRSIVMGMAKKYKISLYEGAFTVGNLREAEEAFLTNSLMGIMPLNSLEQAVIGKKACLKTTEFFIKKYNCLLK